DRRQPGRTTSHPSRGRRPAAHPSRAGARAMSGPVAGLDGTTISEVGTILSGRKLGEGRPANEIGSFQFGRPSTQPNVAAGRRWFLQASIDDFRVLDDGTWVDEATGQCFERLLSDPLFAEQPSELGGSIVFCVGPSSIVFLSSRGITVADLDAAAVAQEERA